MVVWTNMVYYFGFTTEVRTRFLFYIYGSWVSKRILILRDRIPNFSDNFSAMAAQQRYVVDFIGQTTVSLLLEECLSEVLIGIPVVIK